MEPNQSDRWQFRKAYYVSRRTTNNEEYSVPLHLQLLISGIIIIFVIIISNKECHRIFILLKCIDKTYSSSLSSPPASSCWNLISRSIKISPTRIVSTWTRTLNVFLVLHIKCGFNQNLLRNVISRIKRSCQLNSIRHYLKFWGFY